MSLVYPSAAPTLLYGRSLDCASSLSDADAPIGTQADKQEEEAEEQQQQSGSRNHSTSAVVASPPQPAQSSSRLPQRPTTDGVYVSSFQPADDVEEQEPLAAQKRDSLTDSSSIQQQQPQQDDSWLPRSDAASTAPPSSSSSLPLRSHSSQTTPLPTAAAASSLPQSVPTVHRRLAHPSTIRHASAKRGSVSQPSSPPHSQPVHRHSASMSSASLPASQSPGTPSSHHPTLLSASSLYHDVPLAPHPSFSLHHRHHHLHKFLSSPLGSALLLNKLRTGAIFLKHGQRGAPHYRHVSVTADLRAVCWSELSRRGKLRGSMEVSSLQRVEEGHWSASFGRWKGSDASRCFSLLGDGRTLDVECVSEEDREMWSIAFAFLIEFTRRGGAAAGEALTAASTAGIPPTLSLVSALELLCDQNQTLLQSKAAAAPSALHLEDERKEATQSLQPVSAEAPVLFSASTSSLPSSSSFTSAPSSTLPQPSPPGRAPSHPSPSSSITVSHVHRFEVIDIIDSPSSLPPPPAHHLVSSLSLATDALPPVPAAAFEDPRVLRLARDLEQYKEDNKRLLLSHAQKMMRLQREIDALQHINRKLRGMKGKLDRSTAAAAVPAGHRRRDSAARRDGCAGSEGEAEEASGEDSE